MDQWLPILFFSMNFAQMKTRVFSTKLLKKSVCIASVFKKKKARVLDIFSLLSGCLAHMCLHPKPLFLHFTPKCLLLVKLCALYFKNVCAWHLFISKMSAHHSKNAALFRKKFTWMGDWVFHTNLLFFTPSYNNSPASTQDWPKRTLNSTLKFLLLNFSFCTFEN